MLTGRIRRAAGDDRGAVAVIVIVLFASMVLFAMGALAIDTGQFYSEKAQLQNGADSGAVAVANSCAGTGGCKTAPAQHFADKNANDNTSAVDFTCGGPISLGPCPTTGAAADRCPRPFPSHTKWVDVQTKTRLKSGSNILPPIFGRAVLGNQYAGVVRACARAIWGPPKLGVTLALTFAECVWNRATADNTSYAPSPPTLPSASFEQVLNLSNPDDPADPTCADENSVGPVPGGFGWTVATPNSPCTASLVPGTDNWYQNDTGKGTDASTQCTDKAGSAGVIPCAANPVVPLPPRTLAYDPGPANACPSPATPSPILVPIYNQVCSMTGSAITQDEIQSITINNKATGGTYTLTFTDATGVAKTTGRIAWNASAATVQAALAALTNIGAGNVSVTGASPLTGYRVQFIGTLAHTNFAKMGANGSALIGNGAKVTVGAVQDGSFSATTCPSGPFVTGKSYYHLLTLAAFVITGYGGPSFQHDQKSWLTGLGCPIGGTGCIRGYFVQMTDPGGEVDPGGVSAGVTAVQLVG
jgi:hypothetical protein